VDKALDLEQLSCVQEGGQIFSRDVHLSGVDKLDDCFEIRKGHITENDDWMFAGILLEV